MEEKVRDFIISTTGRVIKWLFAIIGASLIVGWITTFRDLATRTEVKQLISIEVDKRNVTTNDLDKRVSKLEVEFSTTMKELKDDINSIKVDMATLVGREQARKEFKK